MGQSASTMLTAWDKARETTLALPDFESRAELARVRERTRQGELVCPTCRQMLWVHAGEILIPHFAHRQLSDCPHGRVSEAVLGARRLLYRFFQARIENGKLAAEIILEPAMAGLPERIQVDLLLRRAGKSAVHVVLIERGLKPVVRDRLWSCLAGEGKVLRPVFLKARLKHPEGLSKHFLLDPALRECRLRSVFDLAPPDSWREPGTLHFIEPASAEWTTLRGVSLVHEPQVFRSHRVEISPMERLLWSEGYVEWVHPGEAEKLKEFRKALEAERRRRSEKAKRPAPAPVPPRPPAPRPLPPSSAPLPILPPPPRPKPEPSTRPRFVAPVITPEVAPVDVDPLPAWISEGLVCVGCGQRTTAWQNAAPDKDQCVCRTCFTAGVRLGKI